jgi:spore coat polysaccharide biosynthesis protein SpsF
VRTGVFVQVRIGSTRLPSKAILPLPGGTVIQHVMRALMGIPAEARALLTDEESRHALLPSARAEGFEVLAGSPDDVLDRYCAACEAREIDRVVRATGDNPCTSARLANSVNLLHERAHADLSHYLGNPWGTGVEIIESKALFAARTHAIRPEEREHITTWLYRNPDRFTIIEPSAPEEGWFPEGRVTVDTEEDYQALIRLFDELYSGEPIEVDRLVPWLRAHPQYARKPQRDAGGVNA